MTQGRKRAWMDTKPIYSKSHSADLPGEAQENPALQTGQTKNSGTDPRVTQLKHTIAVDDYAVDAGLVASEILEKMRLVRTIREQLMEGPEADRSRGQRFQSRQRGEARHQRL